MPETPILFVDFNALTEDDAVRLTPQFVARQLEEWGIRAGDRVVLTDGDTSLDATVENRPQWGLVAVPDLRR